MKIWKDIPGWEGKYQVSNVGNVKSIPKKKKGKHGNIYFTNGRILKQQTSIFGYKELTLTSEGTRRKYKVHQLVAMAFLGHKPCGHKYVVDHIDDNKQNNHILNLQILTNRQNCSKEKKGKSNHVGVCWDKMNNKWIAQIHINGINKKIGRFSCEDTASKAYQRALNSLTE